MKMFSCKTQWWRLKNSNAAFFSFLTTIKLWLHTPLFVLIYTAHSGQFTKKLQQKIRQIHVERVAPRPRKDPPTIALSIVHSRNPGIYIKNEISVEVGEIFDSLEHSFPWDVPKAVENCRTSPSRDFYSECRNNFFQPTASYLVAAHITNMNRAAI